MSEDISNDTCFCIVVDRIEGNYAVCEFPDMSMRDIELCNIPFKVKEKSTLIVRENIEKKLEFVCMKKVKKSNRRTSRFIRFV